MAPQRYLYNSSVHKLMNIMEAQKLIELEAIIPIFQLTEILVEKFMTYDLVKIYHFLAISQDISLSLALHCAHH